MKKMNRKGFTLAELLIVIAIMAILIAIAIPVFSAQLENARHAVDQQAERSAKSLAEAHYLLEHTGGVLTASEITVSFSKDDDGNLAIKKCTPTYVANSGVDAKKCSAEDDSGENEVKLQSTGTDDDCPYDGCTKLEVKVTADGVSKGWVA